MSNQALTTAPADKDLRELPCPFCHGEGTGEYSADGLHRTFPCSVCSGLGWIEIPATVPPVDTNNFEVSETPHTLECVCRLCSEEFVFSAAAAFETVRRSTDGHSCQPQIPQNAENGTTPASVEAPKARRRARRPIPTPLEWVKAKRIASLFDCSEKAVYSGEYGFDRIRSTYLEAKRPGGRRNRRFWWPDAVELRDRMLDESSERQKQQQQIGVMQFGPRRMRRGR